MPHSVEDSTTRNTSSRHRHSKTNSSESIRSNKPREAYSGNSGCTLFGGGRKSSSSSRSEKSYSRNSLIENNLISLEKQISDKRKLLVSDDSLFFSSEYVKLKLGMHEWKYIRDFFLYKNKNLNGLLIVGKDVGMLQNIFFSISEYANRLSDEGLFQQALEEIVDLFVSKYKSTKSISTSQANDQHQR